MSVSGTLWEKVVEKPIFISSPEIPGELLLKE